MAAASRKHPAKPPIELYLARCTMHAQDRGRGCSADGQEARARVERAWGARTAHLLCILADAHASQPQPASPRPETAAPTRFRRGDVVLVHPAASPSSGKDRGEVVVDEASAKPLEAASTPAASKQQRRRAGSLRPPHEACTAAGAGSLICVKSAVSRTLVHFMRLPSPVIWTSASGACRSRQAG